MKPFSAVLALLALALAFGAGYALAGGQAKCPVCAVGVEPLFSPGAEPEIARLIESANRSIDVELYQFSYVGFVDGLADAKARGVQVRVILEPRLSGDDNLDTMESLLEKGVDAKWASLSFANTHSKTMVVDGKKVLVGSPNWSYSAMFRNREAAVVVESSEIAEEFEKIFEEDWEKAG